MGGLDRIFKLRENNTSIGTEIRAGVVTFLTMSYIVFVQPIILSQTGLSWHTVFVATCVSSAVATLLMAFFANYPIALAPAMGHNVLFLIYCKDGTINWQTGLGAICISGTIFLMLSLWGIREKIVNAIPASIKHAIAVGIGLLIAFLGFQWAGVTADDPAMLVRMGDLHATPVLLALGGLVLTAALIALRLRGAILIGILITAAAGIPLNITSTKHVEEKGLVDMPRSAPMQKLAILPVHAPAGVEVDKAAVLTALNDAAGQYYDPDRVISPYVTPQLLADVTAKPDPKTTPEQMGALMQKPLDCRVLVFPMVEVEEKKEGAAQAGDKKARKELVLKAVAYHLVTTEEGTKGKVWRRYHPISLPASEKELEHYAKDVVLGLPGHEGLLKLDIPGALKLGLLHVIFIFFFLDLFDTIGTLIGVSQQAGFLRDGVLPRARGALLADAFGTVIGAGLGTSTVTSYVESSAGVAEGGRTGLANIVTGLLFIVALFFSPLVEMIGGGYQNLHPAVAPVLIIIGSIMLRNVVHIRWTDPTEALPAFLAIMVMPLTFSITEGIAFGFISYSFLKLVTGRGREVHWLVYLFSVLFIVRYVYVGT